MQKTQGKDTEIDTTIISDDVINSDINGKIYDDQDGDDNICRNSATNDATEIDYTFLSKLKPSSKISTELKRITRKIWYFKMKQRKYTEIERKADTRAKIMMGGLIKKANLDHLHPDKAEVLYGMLLDCKNRLETDPSHLNKWQEMGKDLTNVSKSYSKII